MPLVTYAASLSLGEGGELHYEREEVIEGVHRYFIGERLVAEMRDVDLDGDGDLWIVFKDNMPTLEAHDTNDDSVPDRFYVIEQNSNVLSVERVESETERVSKGPQSFFLAINGLLLAVCALLGVLYWSRRHGKI